MKILVKGKVETVSLERVQPAHFECEPETCTGTQRKTQQKTTNSKTTEMGRGIPKDQIKPRSALTQNSDRTRAKSTANKQTQSATTKIGKNLATQHQAHRVNLPKQFTPYVAPQLRTPDVSRANANDGAVCERIHVYPYIYGVKPLIQLTRLRHRMVKIVRTSPMATKLYRTQL